MNYSWAKNLYDKDGDCYDDCIVAFCGNECVLRFDNVWELKGFAEEILRSIPEIAEAR